MKRYGLIIAIVLMLAVNAFVLVTVYLNRSGTPEASILLTERELPLAHGYRYQENSGVFLKLDWNRHVNELDWFDQDKLDELGFDGSFLKFAESRNRYYQPLPIKAFVVLEYEGEAWETFRDKQLQEIAELPAKVARGEMEPEAAERRNKELETLLRLASRLFAVDVGTEAATLRGRYPDTERYLIAPAQVRARLNWVSESKDKKRVRKLSGRIDKILNDNIHVPRQHHSVLENLPSGERLRAGSRYYTANSKGRIHYQVRLNVGQRYEPWVEKIEAL